MYQKKDASKSCLSIHEYEKMLSVAFQADVENFLTQFEHLESLKFDDFASIWRKMMFSYVNSEQQYYTFIQHFMQNAFFVIKKFIIFPKSIYTEVGALYLLYGMYFKQTVKEWVKIRLTLEDYKKLEELLNRLKVRQELEPLFAYQKLLEADAFEYVFLRKPIAPEQRYLRNCTEFIDDTFKSSNASNSIKELKETLNDGDFFKNYTQAMNTYRKELADVAACNPGLGAFSSTLLEDIKSVLESSPSDDSEDSKDNAV